MDQTSKWAVSSLAEVCELITDGTHHSPPNSDAGDFMYVTAKNIKHWGLDITDITFVDKARHEDIYSRCPAQKGDVLYIKDGVTAGLAAVNHLDDPFSMLSSVALLRPAGDVLNSEFLKHWLNSPLTFSKMTGGMTGSAIRRIILKQIRSAELSLPPLNEQRRIAAKLDTTLAAVESCRQRLDGVEALLKRVRQAVLAAATSGELTRDWMEGRGAEPWRTESLADLADARLGKMLDQSKNAGRPTPYLRNINVRWFSFDLNDIQEIKLSESEAKELDVRFGDLLVCEGGEPGRCAVWRGENSRFTFQKALHRIRPSERLLADFLSYCLRSSADDGSLSALFTGTTIKHLTGSSLKKFRVQLPSRDEQSEIIDRVESLFSLADQLEAKLTSARRMVERLTPALLAKAFRGELVPQDPGDEPASVLLERIRAARQAEAAASGPSRRGRNKAAAKPAPSPVDAAPVSPDRLATLLRECGALSEKALLAASELDPASFQVQLDHERSLGAIRNVHDEGLVLLEAVG
jgi:type I restriction enzyme S subunit